MSRPRTRLLILLPCDPEAPRGNVTTARRLQEELGRRGFDVAIEDARTIAGTDPGGKRADLLLALHAVLSGPTAHRIADAWDVPYAILFTGTDMNGKPPQSALNAVEHAAACVVLGNASGRRARDVYPGCKDTLSVIPQGVAPMPYQPGLSLPQEAPPLADGTHLAVVPAGIREVKDPLRAITALAPMLSEYPDLQLWFVGPELEASTGEALRAACAENDWVTWLGERPRQDLLPILRRASVVLSTSRSEGGPPNSLLEAVSVGAPVLASSIPAHREFPGAESCFRDDPELRKRLRRILEEPERAAMMVRKMQEIVRQTHSPNAEALAWERLLRPLAFDQDGPTG
ncbi:MAG: glycosyltransferase family 4 protein [Planctomycetota bacterium]|jgi:glycosyltransferase involved in cell wall biosynthesis